MGGSDQWAKHHFRHRIHQKKYRWKRYALTTPLLTNSDGSKFGKSEQGNIWLDPKMTSPYKFYQFWLNADDADLPKFFRFFHWWTREDIEQLESQYAEDPRMLKSFIG